ncbi:hypothetical protein M670_01979 [Schinkia azotoformans MEV2011]|uniref:Uncharacterized protein n=1 Tax=Schinkia azotoformans MEV2011 TaxID=1348973 RepID=A0A072NZU6_SCHAZ|nr:hypothetical protein M670_01979 [Schinkia azotoformans MEV2011]
MAEDTRRKSMYIVEIGHLPPDFTLKQKEGIELIKP